MPAKAKTTDPGPKKPLSGGARIKLSGKSPMLLGWTPEEKELLATAAEISRQSMTQFTQYHTLAAARRIMAAEKKKIQGESLTKA